VRRIQASRRILRSGAITLALVTTVAVPASIAGNGDSRGPKRVLLLHSFGPHFEPFRTAASAFRSELAAQSPDPVEFSEFALETARFAEGGIDEPLAEYLRATCARTPPHLVVAIGSPATRFVAQHRDRLFPGIPFLAAAIEQRHLDGLDLGTDATAVTFRIDLARFVEDILRVLPETTRIHVVLGSSPLERYWVAEARRAWQPFEERVELVWLDDLPFSEILERSASLPSRSVIVFTTMHVDAAGVPYELHTALQQLHEVANVPIFGFFEQELGLGIVGGGVVRARELGAESARTALRILRGEPAGTIPLATVAPGTPLFDWRELRRWNIGEEDLPERSEVRFRGPALWEAYRWHIAAVGAFVAIQAILIAVLLRSRLRLRSARARLGENERDLHLATQAAGLGVWKLDLDQGRMWITEAGRGLFGWQGTEPVDFEHFLATLVPEDRDAARRGLQRAVDGGGDFDAEHRILLADGKERWIATRGRVELDREERPVAVRGVSIDITARKQAAIEARELRRELNHADRVSLVGQLTTSLAHELGQPLGAILRNSDAAELLLESDRLDLDELGSILADVRRDGHRAGAVIGRLRALLQRRSIEMQTLSWSEVVAEILDIVRADARARDIVLESDVPRDLPPVRGDRVHLQQVLLNLVVNAMDALDGRRDERRVTVRARQTGDGWIESAVRDTGTGIPADRLATIFDPFFTTKPDGMGMGLPLSRSIVEAHGGRIWVENDPAGGATFRFTVPSGPPPEEP
jgi:PAS domain S-box-containing protein